MASILFTLLLIPLLQTLQSHTYYLPVGEIASSMRDVYIRSDFERGVYMYMKYLEELCNSMTVEQCYSTSNSLFKAFLKKWERVVDITYCEDPIAVGEDEIYLSCPIEGRIGNAIIYIPGGGSP